MPSTEFDLWQQYWNQEPWGPYRDNLHTGIIAAMTYNMQRPKGKPPLHAKDFVMVTREADSENKTASALNWFKAMADATKAKRAKESGNDRSSQTSRKAGSRNR